VPRAKIKFTKDEKLAARSAIWPESGECPLCGRQMMRGRSVNEHHLIPRMYGGIEKFVVHWVCHSKIHSVLTESQLAFESNTFAKLREHPELARFIKWVRKRDPEFIDKHARMRDSERES
jgi:hypothetical protein